MEALGPMVDDGEETKRKGKSSIDGRENWLERSEATSAESVRCYTVRLESYPVSSTLGISPLSILFSSLSALTSKW